MIIIEIKKGENIDIALKRLKFNFRKLKITDQLRERQYFEKPSVKKREIKSNAIYKQKNVDEESL